MVFCDGCFTSFSLPGYKKHSTQSANSACRVSTANVVVGTLSSDENDDHPDIEDTEDIDIDLLLGGAGDELGGLERMGSSEVRDAGEFEARSPDNDGVVDEEEDQEEVVVPLPMDTVGQNTESDSHGNTSHHRMEAGLRQPINIVRYPSSRAGKPVHLRNAQPGGYEAYQAKLAVAGSPLNPYAPFASKVDWEVAQWAKLRGVGSTAVSDLLELDTIREKLELSYKNSRELNKIIDSLPASRPQFQREEVAVGGETYEIYFRDVLDCLRSLFGDPEFVPHLVFLPERHYADPDHTERLFHDMHTGRWWWGVQKAVEATTPGATIMPIIISSDKTQVTLFRNKTAYPVYITIGNLPKDIRSKPGQRGQVLLCYLTTAKLDHITNKAARRRTLLNLFHASMKRVLSPLENAGKEGVVMLSGDGVARRVHPIFAAYVGDYQEYVTVTGIKTGECPVCEAPRDELGDLDEEHALRSLEDVLGVLEAADELTLREYKAACKSVGLKPVYQPFWADLPYSDIFISMTPDILHQIYQGIVKHLLSWLKKVYSPTELDARCRSLPPNHNVRLFLNGITHLSKLTGREHADICRIVLGLLIGIPLPDGMSSTRLLRAVRGLLDFIYLAQYPIHSVSSLNRLDAALTRFHENKEIFIDLGARSHFHFPKLHFLRHYRRFIENLGTTDNFNTEYTERLHIEMAKNAYHATNKKDEYPQMTLWLERKEKVLHHARFVKWRVEGCPATSTLNPLYSQHVSHIKMTAHPSVKSVEFARLAEDYGAVDFAFCLSEFVVSFNNPNISRAQLNRLSANYRLQFNAVSVYHKAKLWESDFPLFRHASDEYDVVHAVPGRSNSRHHGVPGRFDTALIDQGTGGQYGIEGYRVGQVRVIFTLPKRHKSALFPRRQPPEYLAYVEWFSPFSPPDSNHQLYKLTRSMFTYGGRKATVIPLTSIRRSVHLYPCFEDAVPREWTSSNVLDKCERFFVNPFADRHMYGILA